MNRIDEAIEKFGLPKEEYRIRGLILFDYYLTKYRQIAAQRFTNIKQINIGRKAMTNFFLVCLSSVSETDYGLFEVFRRFGIICGWQQRLVSATYIDAERLGSMIPNHHTLNGCWVVRKGKYRHRIWEALGEQSISELIGTSSLAQYAKMIDDGIENIIAKMPNNYLIEFKNNGSEQKEWIDWLTFTAQMHFVEDVSRSIYKRSYDIRELVTIEEAYEDKKLLLQNL